jgi:D-xylose 1-dehydrogenase (NADP+, D-xylono-1,5-lactone-forming)
MTVSFGLLSTARINRAILHAAAASDAVEVVAVASRDAARAEAYAREHGIARAHGSYEALLADPGVEAVYVGLPNGLHAEWTLRALEAGKHVLVEKAFDARAAAVEACFDAAERGGLVLSEAFMWRHHPQTARLAELAHGGAVGEVRLVRATFSFPLADPGNVRWDPALQGGALLDVGCYCVSALRLLAGEPARVAGERVVGEHGVDVRCTGVLRFAGGVLGTFDCGFDLPPRHAIEVVGAQGTLHVADPWHARAPGIDVHRPDGTERVAVEHADPYRLELEDVAAAIREGRPPLLGREDAVGQAHVLEELLR